MASHYRLNLLLRGLEEPLDFEVRKDDWARAQGLFGQLGEFGTERRFLVFNSIEGLAVAVSVEDVQMVHFLCDPAQFASDQKRKEDRVRLWIRARAEPVEVTVAEEKDELAAFFVTLDAGTDLVPFPGFYDSDGELLYMNAAELVMVTAPLHEVNEGHRKLNASDDNPAAGSDDLPF